MNIFEIIRLKRFKIENINLPISLKKVIQLKALKNIESNFILA